MDNNLIENMPAEESIQKDNIDAAENEKKLAVERQNILNDAVSGRINDDRSKVAFLLNNSIDSRNSDKELVWLYWQTFEKGIFDGNAITREVYNNLTPQGSIIRVVFV